MRLTCPRCGAQYEIARAAIPPAGREVECSACSHVWHQPGAEESSAPYDAAARPTLNRPLNESILSILREETARELQAREGSAAKPASQTGQDAADAAANRDATAAGTPSPVPAGGDWPATTLTDTADDAREKANASDTRPQPARPPSGPQTAAQAESSGPAPAAVAAAPPPAVTPALPDAAELAATLTRSGPAPASQTARSVVAPADAADIPAEPTEKAKPPQGGPSPAPAQADTGMDAADPGAQVASAGRGSGYATGFGLAAMLALGVVAVYTLAPRVSADGNGGLLAEWRQDIDRGRLWLHDRIIGPPPTSE